jgi:hypothetical protein
MELARVILGAGRPCGSLARLEGAAGRFSPLPITLVQPAAQFVQPGPGSPVVIVTVVGVVVRGGQRGLGQ